LDHLCKSKYSVYFGDCLFSWIVYLFRHRFFPLGYRNSTMQDGCLHHPFHLQSQDVHLEPSSLESLLSLVRLVASQIPEWHLEFSTVEDFSESAYLSSTPDFIRSRLSMNL
jgi:hypothetical protein